MKHCTNCDAPHDIIEGDSWTCRLCGQEHEPAAEVCSSCEGHGSITYNPNLNPNAFPATATAKCTHCGGTGRTTQLTPTPEADAVGNDDFLINPGTTDKYVPIDFARKLERERDEARKDYAQCQQQLEKIMNDSVYAERDQLRKVCDELAAWRDWPSKTTMNCLM